MIESRNEESFIESQKFQVSGNFQLCSVRFCSPMLEADLALGQSMKVVDNGIL